MVIRTFAEYIQQKATALDPSTLHNAAALYSLYIKWLIETHDLKKAPASELFVQLRAINAYILNETMKFDPEHEKKINELVAHCNRWLGGKRAEFAYEYTGIKIHKPLNELFTVGFGIFVVTGLIFHFSHIVVHASGAAFMLSFLLAPIWHFGVPRLSQWLAKKRLERNDPMNPLMISVSHNKIDQSVFKNTIFEGDTLDTGSDYNSLIQKTNLSLYETSFPKGVFSSPTDHANKNVDLEILSKKLTQGN